MQICTKIKPLILVGCSGAGRSAIIYHLTRNLPHKFERLISYTTRKPRPSEKDGRDFYFVNQEWIQKNKEKFVTLTYSENKNYYGLTNQQVQRVMNNIKIPVFKMTIDAYSSNIGKASTFMKSQKKEIQKQDKDKIKLQDSKQYSQNECCYIIKNKSIQVNSLYITLPSLSELQKRLNFSPFTPKQRSQKLQKARKQHGRVQKYFSRQNIIGKYFQQNNNKGSDVQFSDFEDVIIRVKSRLFQLY